MPIKKSYLVMVIAVVALGLVFTFKFLFGNQKITALNKEGQDITTTDNLTLDNLLLKDSDGDKIPDWEETLWGTDPKNKASFEGMPDGDYIKNKKEGLKLTDDTGSSLNSDEKNLTETDKFARQFFATFIALKQSGQVDADTVNGIALSLGQDIVSADLPDKYHQADLALRESGKENNKKYYAAVQNLFNAYQNTKIGEEINILGSIAGNESATIDQKAEVTAELDDISDVYKDFAQKLIKISVPSELTVYHLKIANSSYNTGVSIENLTKSIDDPIVGLAGLSQYEKYSKDLISAANDLKTYLSKSGILLQ